MVGEIILGVKERNKAARATAFDLLVQVGCCCRCRLVLLLPPPLLLLC